MFVMVVHSKKVPHANKDREENCLASKREYKVFDLKRFSDYGNDISAFCCLRRFVVIQVMWSQML